MEGDGDQGAVPVVIRSHLHQREVFDLEVGKPINAKGRTKLLREGELERFAKLAAIQADTVGVLVLCDADDDPPCRLGPEIAARCESAVASVPIRGCLAVREFENWLLASPETLAPAEESPRDDYEAVSAVGRIAQWRAPLKYVKSIHQPSLAARIDLRLASERCPSFARFLRCVDELVEAWRAVASAEENQRDDA